MAPKKKKFSELSESGKFFRRNKASRKNKEAITKEINARPIQKRKRREAGRKRTAALKKGLSIKDKDYDHATDKFVPSKVNRGRAGEGGRKRGVSKGK